MTRIEPAIPFHIARAYGLQPAARPIAAVVPAPAAQAPDSAATDQSRKLIGAILGGIVPGRISFSGESPQHDHALPFYRHPADKNAAATAISAGKALDLTA
jgi:hypothetical protein